MILGQNDALRELARLWEEDAGRVRKYDPADPKARVLTVCAEELRRVLGETAPEWVSIGAVQQWTGWTRQTLRKTCRQELGPRQEARKGPHGEWEIALHVALSWPKRGGGSVGDVTDLDELARLVGREG